MQSLNIKLMIKIELLWAVSFGVYFLLCKFAKLCLNSFTSVEVYYEIEKYLCIWHKLIKFWQCLSFSVPFFIP